MNRREAIAAGLAIVAGAATGSAAPMALPRATGSVTYRDNACDPGMMIATVGTVSGGWRCIGVSGHRIGKHLWEITMELESA